MLRRAIVGLLVVVGALTVAPAAFADDCPGQPPMGHPFAAWGDDGDYFIAPGGDFDATSSWTLSGGASVQGGLSPNEWGDSLVLPAGATALSPPICVADGYRHARMMGEAVSGDRRARSSVGIDVLYGTGDYKEVGARVGDAWDATRRYMLGQDFFDLDPTTGLGEIQLRFTGEGPDTAVLDGVYVDPTARH